ncbi:helix-turn-helix domain-containing protein [Agrilactobacillus fermenti]|uniref:helix-turn-helix domain-containing protein n=1 Tax=Agrilactobacillus fermenti TaxID=2586909 RepID=UPI003A5BE455
MTLGETQQVDYNNLVEYIGRIQGRNSDIILTELRTGDFPVVQVKNGSIVDAREGDKTPDVILDRIQAAVNSGLKQFHEQFNLKHKTVNLSILLMGREHSEFAISVITDVSPFMSLLRVSTNLAKLYQLDAEVVNSLSNEVAIGRKAKKQEELSFADKVHQMVRDKIDQIVLSYGIDQENFKARDRRKIVAQLNKEGVFNMKYSVSDVARALQVSEPTIYRYIQELKSR